MCLPQPPRQYCDVGEQPPALVAVLGPSLVCRDRTAGQALAGLAANPMQLVGRPKLARPLPKALPRTAVQALLETVARDEGSKHQTGWAEGDLALILIALLAGLRSEELRLADIGDIRTTENRGATIHVRGKGGKERSVPIEAELLSVIEAYLDSRAIRFPGGTKRKAGDSTSALSRWPARSPLFVGRDGE